MKQLTAVLIFCIMSGCGPAEKPVMSFQDAILKFRVDIVKQYIENGIDVNKRLYRPQNTSALYCCVYGMC